MRNRLNGPHDIVAEEYPETTEPMGFHLSETAYQDVIKGLREIGKMRFKSFLYV